MAVCRSRTVPITWWFMCLLFYSFSFNSPSFFTLERKMITYFVASLSLQLNLHKIVTNLEFISTKLDNWMVPFTFSLEKLEARCRITLLWRNEGILSVSLGYGAVRGINIKNKKGQDISITPELSPNNLLATQYIFYFKNLTVYKDWFIDWYNIDVFVTFMGFHVHLLHTQHASIF